MSNFTGAPRMRAAAALLLLSSAALSACATVHAKTGYYKGNVPDLQLANVKTFTSDQGAILESFEELAGTPNLKNGDDWRPVVDAGMGYVDVRCERFMDALFWLNRVRETSSKQVQYVGAAASALLALVSATKQLIGITPLGFGLLDQTVNNVGQGLLYNLDPGIVAGLVGRQQATYRAAMKDSRYTTRGATLQAIQQYAVLCLPVSIEGEVNRAITNSQFKTAPPPAEEKGAEQPSGDEGAATGQENEIPVIEQKQPE